MLVWASVGISGVACGQGIVSSSFNPATGALTAQDSAGDLFTANLGAISPTSTTTLNGTFAQSGNAVVPVTLTVQPTGAGQFTVTGTVANQLAFTCSVNTITFAGSCNLAPSSNVSQSLASSITGEVRGQTSASTDSITSHLRGAAQELAQGLSPQTPPAAPGDTLILNNFSSNQPMEYRYGGLSAGSPDSRWGAWVDSSGSFLNNSTASGYNGTSVVALTGLDYLVDRQFLLGMNAGYTRADLSLKPSTISHDVNGALVGPYAAYVINPNLALDALFNYTSLYNSITAPLPLPSGNYHSNRLTGAADLNVFTNYNSIKLTGYGGYVYSWEGGNASSILGTGIGNNITYGAVRLGGEAAYAIGAFEPYVPVTFEYETTNPNDGTSRAALILGAGLRYRWSDALTGGILAETTEVKSHTRDVMISAHLRWSF